MAQGWAGVSSPGAGKGKVLSVLRSQAGSSGESSGTAGTCRANPSCDHRGQKAVEGVHRGRMASKAAVNGHAAPISHQEDVPEANHVCQGTQPCKQKKAMDAREPSEVPGSIAGVYVEALKKIMSFYDATREHLLSLDPALFLLEAQAAMGFIADPVKNRHVSVAEAVHLGLVGLELKEKLLSAEKAATGFVDPYTEEKISLYQAIQKDLIGREQGARLLEAQMATGGIIDPATGCRLPADVACERGYLDEEMTQLFSDPSNEDSKGFLDPSTMERVTYMELIKRCVVDPASGFLLLPLQITFAGLGGRVSSRDLLEAGIISPETFRGLEEGRVSAQEVAENDSVQQFLRGTRSIAGVVLPSSEQKSLYQAMREHLLLPGTALMLLQVQASTGSLTDPIKNKTFSVDEAVRTGLIGPELHEKLSSAERTITGYRDPCTGEMLSLFQAIRKAFIPKDHGICLLEAQMATGGIIAPGRHFRVPTETACKWGYLDETTRQLLSSPAAEVKGFFDPSSKEKLTYADLLKRCVTDPNTGLLLLPLSGDSGEGPNGTPVFFDHKTQTALENTKVPITLGKFKGKSVSLWKLLFSDYIQSEQRAALTQQYLAGMLSTQQLAKAVSVTIEEMASTANVTFEGLRGRVTADQLLSSEIINKDLFKKLKEGETSAKEVVSMDTVKKYLQGTGSIAGLLLPDSQEKMSIYQAKRKGFLRPGTSLILLEAQAATGFIIDPAANKRYSVDEALQADVIGPDVYDKLLTAEKSVTGYRDPYSGTKISLFQAMKKELIVKEHAIRLLEAQIATGGIIDPVNSHRIPVEVAYKRGYFDKKINVILSDPSDDTKGFFDPNTHENLTYLQLKEKCITEPSTGLCLLPLNSRKRQFIDDTTRQLFRTSWLPVRFGRLRGERVSVWDLLNSEYFSEGRRREIFNHYRLRKLTLEQIRIMLEEEIKKWAPIKFPAMRGSISAYHLMETGIIDRALFEKVLEGSVTPEEVLRMDSVRRYLYGSGSIGGIVLQPSNQRISIYEAMKQNIMVPGVALPLLEAQAATGFIIDPVNNQKLCVDDAVKEGVIGPEVHEKLQQAEGAVSGYKDPFTGKKIPLFQAMKKGLITDKQAMQLMEVQMATGGIIDPTCGHHIPIEAAQKRGCLDEDTSKALSKPNDNNRAFCIPDSKETVTYAELIERCQKDEISGFHLLPLPQTAIPVYTDEQIQQLFKETVVKEKGVSLWELIHSGYFTDEQRSDFVERFRAKETSLEQLVALVLRLVREMEMKACTHITFQGLQGSVPAVWLLEAGIITEKMFEELAQGIRTPEEVAEMGTVKRYLQGTGSIAGVIIQASKKKMSFYNAMKNNLLLPGAALKLLEAQAATGYLTDPATSQRLSVRDAVRAAVVGEELTEKLLLAERAVTGYTDPYTGSSISLCQAVRKELIPLGEAIPLLEAQLATGGVIDPIHHHHLPLQAAYRYGFYDEDLNQNLTQLNDSTKIFFDPNTKENVTYQQLKDRCIYEPETGLWFLPLSENAMFCVDEQTMEMLKSVTVCVNIGRFKGQTVSVWDLLNSEYISDSKRRELVQKYKDENTEVLHEIIMIVMKIIKETEVQGKKFAFKGLRKKVSASDLFQSQLIDKKTLDELNQGKKTVKEVTEMDSVRRYLEGSNFIAGVLIQPSNEKMSIYQAMRKGILRPGTALVLLEAQAATGFIVDPLENKKLSVDEAILAKLVGSELHEKLLSAEKAVTGYADPQTGTTISLFQAIMNKIIIKEHGIRLLEAQIATGGIIDPVHSHRIPVEVAYRRGYLDGDMFLLLSDPDHGSKGFIDPNTHEKISYSQLLQRCSKDRDTGLYLLQVMEKEDDYFYIDEQTKNALISTKVQVSVGKYKGNELSLWELLYSEYITEEKRKELVKKYKEESHHIIQRIIDTILNIIKEKEEDRSDVWFQGIRQQITASELLSAEIITEETMQKLQEGKETAQKIAQMDDVRRYLEGTGSIAGVLVPSKADTTKMEKMSIYQAMWKGILRQGTALVLLEAQAASGFLTDPVRNAKLSVKEALTAGLIGRDFYEKLLSAEGAVTGYTEPYTGHRISLFQAMKKEFIVKEHAIRLLEAQIATGGIIDPINSHRLPVEVAYQRGYFDQEMCQFLLNHKNQTRSCFDPNTHENLTYTQLLRRCVPDPDTGLLMLQVMDKGSVLYQLSEDARKALQAARTTVSVGLFQGQSVTVWELLFSRYISERQREELLRKYKVGTVTIPEMITTLTAIITKAETGNQDLSSSTATPSCEVGSPQPVQVTHSQEQQLRKSLKSATIYVTAGEFQGQNVSLLDLLFSKYIPQGKRQELLELYRAGILTTEQVATVVTTTINKTEAANTTLAANTRSPQKVVTRAEENGDDVSAQDAHLDNVLKSTTIDMPAGEFSVWDLLFSDYISEDKRQELLELYRGRVLTLEKMITVVTTLIKKKESTGRKFLIAVKPSNKDTVPVAGEKDADSSKEESWETALKTTVVDMEAGEFQGHKVSVWDLLHSKYIPEENRKELLELYQAGELTLEQVKTVVSTIVTKAEEARAAQSAHESSRRAETTVAEAEHTHHLQEDRTWEESLKSTTVEMAVDEFQGRQVSVWDLLFSDYISEDKRQELLELYCTGTLALEQMITVVTTLIKKKKSTGRKFLIAVKPSNKDTVPVAGEKDADSSKEESWETALKTTVVDMEAGEFQGHKVSVWDLLHSKYIPEENRKELLELYQAGELTLEQVKTVVSTIVTKAEEARAAQSAHESSRRAETTVAEAEHTHHLQEDRTWEESLKSTTVEMAVDEFQGRQVSVWDLLFSDYISEDKRQELLELYCAGTLPIQELINTISSIAIDSKERKLATLPQQTVDLLQSEGSYITFGQFQEQRVSVWELLSTKQVSEYKREAHLDTYGTGGLTVNKITITTTVVTGPQGKKRHHQDH
ncbi:epiplakin [Oxyura jamaicensis]|uniref:epiplakin n=1 Tax=Oxyura jamaicensis TaxID=8884 RepID=UPI0015A6832F|nr:epiplakin [Oxyura jamaicensis]